MTYVRTYVQLTAQEMYRKWRKNFSYEHLFLFFFATFLFRYLNNDRLSPSDNILIEPTTPLLLSNKLSTTSKPSKQPHHLSVHSSSSHDATAATNQRAYQSVLSLDSVKPQHRGSYSCRPMGLPTAQKELHVVNGKKKCRHTEGSAAYQLGNTWSAFF